MITPLTLETKSQGLKEITAEIKRVVQRSGISEGLCVLFLQHTSASLLIQENADPSARADLEAWLDRLVKENDALFTHTSEGADDMPSHIKAALTATSLSIPIVSGELVLGTWQGIYLWEHRKGKQTRHLVVYIST